MEVLIIQKDAFEEMTAKFNRFCGTYGCPPCQVGQQVIKPVDGQSRSLPTVEH